MTSPKKILVVNPNSNETVTRSLAEALQPLSSPGRPRDRLRDAGGRPATASRPRPISDSVVMPLRGWWRPTTRPMPSSLRVIPTLACMPAARRRGVRCSASRKPACSRRWRAASDSASSPLREPLDPAAHAQSAPDVPDRSLRRRASAGDERRGNRFRSRHAGADDRGRPRIDGSGRRQCHRDGLRGHVTASRCPRRRARRAVIDPTQAAVTMAVGACDVSVG